MKVSCPGCGQRFKTEDRESGNFELRGGYDGTPVVKCFDCGQLMFAKPFTRRVKPVPPDVSEYLEQQWAQYTSPYATGVRWAEREERRRAYAVSQGETPVEAYEDGVLIPEAFYCWPDGLELRGDLNDSIFLDANMPPELQRIPKEEFAERGVRVLEGEKAFELLVQKFVDEADIALSAAGYKSFMAGYLYRIEELQKQQTGDPAAPD